MTFDVFGITSFNIIIVFMKLISLVDYKVVKWIHVMTLSSDLFILEVSV